MSITVPDSCWERSQFFFSKPICSIIFCCLNPICWYISLTAVRLHLDLWGAQGWCPGVWVQCSGCCFARQVAHMGKTKNSAKTGRTQHVPSSFGSGGLARWFFYFAWPKRTEETQERSLRWTDFVVSFLMGKPHGYGSIPIDTIFSGMNIHLPAILGFTRGTRFWHTATCCVCCAATVLHHSYRHSTRCFSAIINGAPQMQILQLPFARGNLDPGT